jgi:hypothetical protein
MLEQVETLSPLESLMKRISEALWLSGKLHYELEVKQQELEDVKIQIRNLNQEAKKFQKEARKEAMKVDLAPAPEVTPEIPNA